jgi:predicted nuclease with TOPRIM domain
MKSKEEVSIKKVIRSLLGNVKSPRYLHGLDFVYVDSNDIYQGSLNALLSGDSEKTIKCIIFGLDLDRDNNSIIHLARTMMFSLSEDFHINEGHMLKQKYGDFERASEQLQKKIEKQRQEISLLEEKEKESEEKITKAQKNFLTFIFKKSILTTELKLIQVEIRTKQRELVEKEDTREQIISLIKIEEYIKILSTVTEVCIFPSRYAWALSL